MPTTIDAAGTAGVALTPSERLDSLDPAGRLRAYERGELSRVERWLWANRFPEEVPLVNGELPWIAFGLADLD